MPLILGPNTPPTLAVAIMNWFHDVDLSLRIKASAGDRVCADHLVVIRKVNTCDKL